MRIIKSFINLKSMAYFNLIIRNYQIIRILKIKGKIKTFQMQFPNLRVVIRLIIIVSMSFFITFGDGTK